MTTRIEPLDPNALPPEMADGVAKVKQRMGFVPTAMRVLGRRPEIALGLMALGRAVYSPSGTVPLALKNLVGLVASRTAGCMYCTAHAASNASQPDSGVDARKSEAVWEYETSELFTEAERAALAFAQCAAAVPNAVTDEHFAVLYQHFDEGQVVEILSVVAYFGFLNRWNDSLATTLEDHTREFAEAHLSGLDWSLGKHV